MKRLQAFVFELKPNGAQQRAIRRFAGCCRFVFNKALARQRANYESSESHPEQRGRAGGRQLRRICGGVRSNHSKRTRTPPHTALGAPGETALSFGKSLGLAMSEPLGLKELLVRNPAVA